MEKRSVRTLKLIGGWLCLDFTNTLEMHASDRCRELLLSYFDLVEWCHHTGIITKEREKALLRRAEQYPEEAEQVLRKALELREILFQIFSSVAGNKAPPEKFMIKFNRYLSQVLKNSKLESTESGIEWDVAGNRDMPDWPLNLVVHSGFRLLTSGELDRVKMCADNRGCGWLFFDSSKNRSRRWCDMADCGNLAKQKRFYGKKHHKNSA
jgi:predicted RNA-binding Zn ribbon-like protein